MFDRFRKKLADKVEEIQQQAAFTPPDLTNVPYAGHGQPNGLADVDPAVLSGFLGIDVAKVGPLSKLGPENTGLLGSVLQQRMRAAGAEDLPPGELFAGQNELRMQKMRENGASEEMIQMIQERIKQVTAEHQARGWTITFANGHHASIEVWGLDDAGSEFEKLRAAYQNQHTRSGIENQQDNWFASSVDLVRPAPFEMYYTNGRLAARGQAHVISAKSNQIGTGYLKEMLAAIACLGIRAVEG